jgi:hypothetical protein
LTTFPSLTRPVLEDDEPTPIKIERAIAHNRAITPKAVAEQRSVPRLSVAELNGLDLDTIREKYISRRYDDRPAIVRVLDTLDLPRNALWNVLAPGVARRAKERGDTGTFGLGRFSFSDVLNEAGVSNRIVRGIVGTGLDIASDPLLFIGGIGGVAKLTSETGKAVHMTRGFTKAVRAADEAIAAGRGLDMTTEIGRALKAAGVDADIAARTPGIASKALIGDYTGGLMTKVVGADKAGQIADRLSRVPRAGTRGNKGMVAEYFGREGLTDAAEAAKAAAAKELVQKFGVQAAPGWKIGKGGTQVFHLPFTDFNVQIPALGAEGARRVVQGIAAASPPGQADRAVNRNVQAMEPLAQEIDNAWSVVHSTADPLVSSAAIESADRALEQMRSVAKLRADAATPMSPNDILAIGEKMRQAEAKAKAIKAKMPDVDGDFADIMHKQMDAYVHLANAYKGSITQFVAENPQAMDMVNLAKKALGTDSDIMGASVMTPLKTVLEYAGLKDSTAYEYALKVERGIESVFGRRSGRAAQVERAYRNALTIGQNERAKEIGVALRDGFVKILGDHGLDPAVHLDDAANLAVAYALKARAEAGGADPVIWTTEFGTGEMAEFLKRIDGSLKSGLLSKAATGDLGAAIEQYARETILPVLDTMGEIIEQGDLGKVGRDYFPYMTTAATAGDIRSTMRQQLTTEGARAVPQSQGLPLEGFQKGKEASLEYRFKSARPGFENQERRFFHSDLGWLAEPPEVIEAMRADPSKKEIVDLIDDVLEYRNMPEPPAPKYADPFTINGLYNQGRFDILTGGRRRPEGYFDTNAITLMAGRTAAHERAVARRTWAEYMGQHGVSVDARKMQGVLGRNGTDVQMPDGSMARIVNRHFGGREYRGVEYGGSFYRPLSVKAGSLRDNPLIKGMGIDDLEGRLFHSDIADRIERAAELFSSDDTTRELLKTFDELLAFWKKNAVFRPGFFIQNAIGDALNSVMGAARLRDFRKHGDAAIRIALQHNNPEALRAIQIDAMGQRMTGEELWRILEDNKVVDSAQMADVMSNIVGHRYLALPSDLYGRGLLKSLTDPAAAVSDVAEDYAAAARRYAAAKGMDNPKAVQKAQAAGFLVNDRLSQWFYGPWARVNQTASNAQRVMTFLSHLEQGNDIATAAQKTIHSLFDYSWHGSQFERGTLRRLFPFLSWMRNNGAYQMHLLAHRPIYAGSFPLLARGLEEMIDGDERLPQYMRPNWMREQLAIQFGRDPNHRVFYLPRGSFTPEMGLQYLTPLAGPDGLQDYLKMLVGSLNPLITKPMEYGVGREFFSGREINADPMLSEIGPGGFTDSLIPPLAEAKKVLKIARDKGAGQAAVRFLVGGRIQDGSDDRLNQMLARDFKAQEEGLRRTITRAHGEGNAARRLVANARLLQLYQKAMTQGLEAQVPKWARERLTAGSQ